ncbi:MAG: amino acid adenylation domain-containing protein [Nocardioides sp.]|uniref:non-ribosomal peptide synthetase n=1 Tax=Nocardioides sp. TaxID=35761 RepID=UPI0039E2352F
MLHRLRQSSASPRDAAGPELMQRPRQDRSVPSFQQEQMWFVDALGGGGVRNNSTQAFALRGSLDMAALTTALVEIVHRHEVLRTRLIEEGGFVWQVVEDEVPLDVPLVDLSALPLEERNRRLAEVEHEHLDHDFDLGVAPLFSPLVVRLSQDEHRLLWVVHHVAWDPGSRHVFLSELIALHDAFSRSQPSPLPDPELQYADYAIWQRERMKSEYGAQLVSYWQEHLRGLEGFELPPDRPRPPERRFRGRRVSRIAGDGLLSELNALSQQHKATTFMTLLAGLDALFHRWTYRDDVTVATAAMLRRRPELAALIGCFVNMTVLRVDVGGDPTFAELLGRVRTTVLDAFEHDELPFEKVVEAVAPRRDPRRNPLFQIEFTMFAGEPAAPTADVVGGLEIDAMYLPDDVSRFDLSVMAMLDGDDLVLSVEYDTDLYEESTVELLLERYELILRGAVADPEAPISALPLMSQQDADALVGTWADGGPAESSDATLQELFDCVAARQPDAPAVRSGERTLSYRDLQERSVVLANRLHEAGVRTGDRVGLRVDRSEWFPIAVLAILRAGAAYVPVDSDWPAERVRTVLDNAGTELLVSVAEGLPKLPDLDQVVLDPTGTAPEQSGDRSPGEPAATPDDLAYVLFTSGSTGQPKGVMIEHRSVVAFTRTIIEAYDITPADRLAQFALPTFDVSVFDLFASLCAGAELVIVGVEERRDPAALQRLLRSTGVTVAELPPSLVPALDPAALPGLRLLSLGGEPFPGSLVDAWASDGRRVVNGYGPSETTVAVTLADCLPGGPANPPIGRPIRGHRAYVLDEQRRPVPVGVLGELYVAGPQVARGYLSRPDLTRERFQPDPFTSLADQRMYRTGDLVRWRPDKQLEFIGRIDRQVKIRGHRIELAEVEAAVVAHPDVFAAVVETVGAQGSSPHLVAYIEVPVEVELTVSAVRSFVADRLPGYMVPAQVVRLPELPRTSSGKVDRERLPAPSQERPELDQSFRQPTTALERRLATEVFGPLLKLTTVGVDDDFFELGGSSLQATQLVARVRSELGEEIRLADFFVKPTVAAVAELIERAVADDGANLDQMLDRLDEFSDDEAADYLSLLQNGEAER